MTESAADVTEFESLVLGGLAGSLTEILVMPPMVVRTRMMVQGVEGAAASSQRAGGKDVYYRSFAHAVQTMYQTEGLRSFYKGGIVNAAFTPLARGLYMMGLESSRKHIGQGSAVTDFIAGMSAQLVSSIAYVPRDIVVERCAVDGRIQSQVGSTATSLKALSTISSKEGITGFFRAFLPHQLVWIPFNGLFFLALGKLGQWEEELLTQVSSSKEDTYTNSSTAKPSYSYFLGMFNSFVAAGFAAICTNPIDVVKTRLQVAGANPHVFAYSGAADCLVKLLRTEGPKSLFAGLTGRFLYAAPGFAIWLPLYDLFKSMYIARNRQ